MKHFIAFGLILLLSLPVFAADDAGWTRYRGPNGSGIAPAGDPAPPLTWSATKNIKWTAPLPGPGSSSPIISGDSVFVTCYSGYGVDQNNPGDQKNLKRHLLRLNLADGKVVWDKSVAAALPEDAYRSMIAEHGYASHTPVTDGERVYAFFSKSGVVAYDLAGNQLWRKQVGTRSNGKRWGSAASPILYKNLLIVNASDEGRAIFAFDKISGEEKWKIESNKLEYTYGAPALATLPDGRQELIVAVPYEVWGFNPDSGECTWWAFNDLANNIAPSVVIDGDVAYINGGFPRTLSVAVRVGGKGDVAKTHILWSGEVSSYVPTPVVLDGKLYGVTDGAIAYCLDAKTGKKVFSERLGQGAGRGGGKPVYASVVLAGGRLYAPTRKGGTYVFAARPAFEQLAHNVIEGDDTDFNAAPAVAGGRLYLRSNRALYCIGE